MAPLGAQDTVLCTASMGFRPLREFIEAAGRAGFSAISLCGGDYKSARAAGYSDADIRSMLDDNGLRVAEMDGAVDWLNPFPESQGSGYDLSLPFFGHSEAEFFAMAEAVGARSLTAVDPFDSKASLDRMVEAFGGLCDRAARHGLLVHLEFLSWGPVPDLATAWDIIRLADRPNGGIMLDTLHLVRSGSRDLLKGIPATRVLATQFCDGAVERSGSRFEDAASRQLPGEGDFALVSILQLLRENGCEAPLGIEVMNPGLNSLSAFEVAEKCFGAILALNERL